MTGDQKKEFYALANQMAEALRDHFLAKDLDASGAALDRMEQLYNQALEKFGPENAKKADQFANWKGHELAKPHLEHTP